MVIGEAVIMTAITRRNRRATITTITTNKNNMTATNKEHFTPSISPHKSFLKLLSSMCRQLFEKIRQNPIDKLAYFIVNLIKRIPLK